MRKFIIYNLKFTILLFYILHSTFYISPIFAQTASPSGSLIQKLDALKKDIASKAAEIKNEINKKVQDKAIIGTILKVEDNKMTIQSLNSVKTVIFDEFTEVIGLGNKKIKVTTLEEGDNVASLGDFDDKNNLSAKRIVFLQNYATSSGELVWGKIQKPQGQTINLTDKSADVETIITGSQTIFALGNNEATIADARAEKYMIARGTRLKDGGLRARFVYFIPSAGFVKPSVKNASSSATLK